MMLARLRVAIPLGIALLAAIVLAVLHIDSAERGALAIEQRASTELAHDMHRLQGTAEYFLRQGSLDRVQFELVSLRSPAWVQSAMLFDENEIVLAAGSAFQRGKSAQTRIAEIAPEFARDYPELKLSVLRSQIGALRLINAGAAIAALYPIVLGSADAGLRPNRAGLLYVQRDLSEQKADMLFETRRHTLWLAGFTAAISVLLWLVLHRALTVRLARIALAASLVARGDLLTRTGLTGGDEIADVARSFDSMAAKLLEQVEQLRRSDERVRLMVDGVKDYAIFMLSAGGYVTTWNDGARRITGYPDSEIVGQHISRFYLGSTGVADHVDAGLTIAVRDGKFEDEVRQFRKDGTHFFAHVSITPLQDSRGQTYAFAVVTRDVTERIKSEESIRALNDTLEKRVVERTVELEATNRELETFAYSVSHDLRSPLRAIDGFSQLLLEDYADVLDERGQDYLSRARAATQRMGTLIDDLLHLSRLTRHEMSHVDVDLSELAHEVVAELRRREPGRQLEVVVAPTMHAFGDARLLRIVLDNLLGNAWKYTSKKSTARIEFGCVQYADVPAYFVRDDGAGFDMRYAGKLFGAFQRMHSVEEFPGTGVGLATVARIIQRHGGCIWAEAEVNKGAVFYFTLANGEDST